MPLNESLLSHIVWLGTARRRRGRGSWWNRDCGRFARYRPQHHDDDHGAAQQRSGRQHRKQRRLQHGQPDLPQRRARGRLHRIDRAGRRIVRAVQPVRRRRRIARRRDRHRLGLPDRQRRPHRHQQPRGRRRDQGRGQARLLRHRARSGSRRHRPGDRRRPAQGRRPGRPAAPASNWATRPRCRSATRWSRSATRSASTAP